MKLSHFICLGFKSADSNWVDCVYKKGHMKFILHMPFYFQMGVLKLQIQTTVKLLCSKIPYNLHHLLNHFR